MKPHSEITYHFETPLSKTHGNSFVLLSFASLLPLAGALILSMNRRLSGTVVNLNFLLPFAVIPVIFIIVIFSLRNMNYRGSRVPLASYILLTGIGFLFQKRFSLPESLPATSVRLVHTILPAGHSALLSARDLMNSPEVVSLVSLLLLVPVIRLFSGRVFGWAGEKYMTLFIVTVGFIFLLSVLTGFTGGGKFLFSRTPWELAKVSLPLAFAGFFAENGRFLRPVRNGTFSLPVVGWGPFLLMVFVVISVLALLGDYGQILIYGAVILIMLYVATGSLLYPAAWAFGIALVPAVMTLGEPLLPGHIAERWEIYHNFWQGFPAAEWWNRSYQTVNALFGLHAGGFTGTGIGLGHPDLVPLHRSDFIFIAIAEELGFIGTLAIYLLYLSILVTGIQTAFQSTRRFDFLAVTAVTAMLGCQVFINIGGVINFIPMTGIVLPFLSRGGFSLLTFSTIIGIIMAVSHKNALYRREGKER